MTGPARSSRLAFTMQIVLALEVGVLVGVLGALWYTGAISGQGWLRIAAGWYLGVRALAVAKNFLQTQLSRSPLAPEHGLGLAGTLRLLWGEYYSTLIVYSFLFPFESWLVPQAPAPAATGAGTPIVLVPGFCCNRGYWALFVHWFRQAGLGPVYAVSLEPLLGSIEQNAAALKDCVEAVCAQAQTDKVILIGHSMGGLVIRSYLHHGGHVRIEQAICLGSPHHGTVLANGIASLGENLRQMSRGSSWARQFNENEALPCPVPITAIVTPHDNIVAPQDSALLHYPNARNVSLPGIGHLEMVISRPVFEAAVEALYPIPLLAEGNSP